MSEPAPAQLGIIPPAQETLPTPGGENADAAVQFRLDAPHAGSADAVDASTHDGASDGHGTVVRGWAAAPAEHRAGSTVPLAPPAAPDPEADDDRRLAVETRQLAEHLNRQHAELDRREQRLHVQLAQLDQERRESRMWAGELEASLHEREAGISAQEQALADRAASCLNLEAELKELHEALLRERKSLSEEREQFIADREADRRELDEIQSHHLQELERKRHDLLAEEEQARNELAQQRVLLDNRHHFQQDHLRKTMHEFEQSQNEFRREQQQARTRLEETEAQILLRSRQLDRLRALLEERQASIERERQLLLRERKALEERLQADKEELRAERDAWEHDRETQKADLRRQQDMLALHAENLETRRVRLDRLRAELEETNRQTLELRLAVEESYAQLTQTAGADATKQRVDEARAILAEYYRHTRDALWQQRQELEQLQARLVEQRTEFRTERQSLIDWVHTQEEQLLQREQEIRRQKDALDARDQTWRAAGQRWTNEKLQAETVIRDLLRQLADREA